MFSLGRMIDFCMQLMFYLAEHPGNLKHLPLYDPLLSFTMKMFYSVQRMVNSLPSILVGILKWKFKARQAITSSPIVNEDMVFFGSHDSSFYALDAKGGWVIWRFRMGKGSVVPPCTADNIIFTGSADGLIYAIDAKTAKEIWNFQADHQVSGSPIIHRDSVYCGTADGMLYCIEYRTGRLRWEFEAKGSITCAPIVFKRYSLYRINQPYFICPTCIRCEKRKNLVKQFVKRLFRRKRKNNRSK